METTQSIIKYLGIFTLILGSMHAHVHDCIRVLPHHAPNSEPVLVLNKNNVRITCRMTSEGLFTTTFISDFRLIDQIRMCGLTIWINKNGRKNTNLGIQYPIGYPESNRPTDPERLRVVLQNLPPFEISDYRHEFGFIEANLMRTGTLPSPAGISCTWTTIDEGVLIESFIPEGVLPLEPGQKIRIGYQTGSLGRPELDAYDGVGIYGINEANPTYTGGSAQRERLIALEQYREYTITHKAWSKRISLLRE